jgi:hypothetical protein
MQIAPIRDDVVSQCSKSSHNSEYVIWRRWEDCLVFQETLEMEYSRMAKAKRQRLAAGKGVKRNGIYIHDQASSFESLPPGPDPHSVANNVHDYLPKLTKKGTIFRASQATINQRQKEITALVNALWKDDVPALIKELREDRIITDFFGFWRRDDDLAVKERNRKPPPNLSPRRSSLTSESSQSLPKTPTSAPPVYRAKTLLKADSERRCRSGQAGPLPSPNSFTSSNNVSSRDDQESMRNNSPIILTQDIPIIFGHDPEYLSECLHDDVPLSSLVSLPEDQELKTPLYDVAFAADEEEAYDRIQCEFQVVSFPCRLSDDHYSGPERQPFLMAVYDIRRIFSNFPIGGT